MHSHRKCGSSIIPCLLSQKTKWPYWRYTHIFDMLSVHHLITWSSVFIYQHPICVLRRNHFLPIFQYFNQQMMTQTNECFQSLFNNDCWIPGIILESNLLIDSRYVVIVITFLKSDFIFTLSNSLTIIGHNRLSQVFTSQFVFVFDNSNTTDFTVWTVFGIEFFFVITSPICVPHLRAFFGFHMKWISLWPTLLIKYSEMTLCIIRNYEIAGSRHVFNFIVGNFIHSQLSNAGIH